MFLGKYYHTLEANKRVSLPKAFREQTQDWVVTRGLDGGLFLFDTTTFAGELQQLQERTLTQKNLRDFARLMANDASEVTPDKHGRIQLPEYLTTFAHLTKDIVMVGSMNYVEIWDRDRYHQYVETLEPQAEKIAESLSTTKVNDVK
jgi:MraZ protein